MGHDCAYEVWAGPRWLWRVKEHPVKGDPGARYRKK